MSLDKLSDIDLDGFGSLSYPKDKAVFNASIYPGALDIPGNGIDEDGFLGDALRTAVAKDNLAEIIPRQGKNIVLIVLESARADLLDQKINGHDVTPVMREIAKNGVSIKNAFSHTGYTTTFIKALFNRSLIKNKDDITLMKFLQAAGYQVSILSGQDEAFGDVATETGMKNDGVSYQPQFFYLNIQAGHFPYSHPKMAKGIINDLIPRSEINEENKNWVAATYWNAIANADWAVGKVIESLKERNLLDKTTLVILGDHGESLFDDGFLGHGHAINDTQTKIPLIIIFKPQWS